MRKILLLLSISVFTLNSVTAQKLISKNTSGLWRTASSWNLNRVPQNGDTVIIGLGNTIVIDNNQNLSGITLHIMVYGKIIFSGPGDKISVSAGSSFKVFSGGSIGGSGTPSQSIVIGGNLVFKGNEPDITGPAFANNVSIGFISFSEIALPVKFNSFTAYERNNEVELKWSTSEEINSQEYVVEKSINGNEFTSIGSVKAAGNSSVVNHYSFSDKNINSPVVMYRIKQVDIDGRFMYTSIKMLQVKNGKEKLSITATTGRIVVSSNITSTDAFSLRVVNFQGQVIAESRVTLVNGVYSFNTSLKGNYIVSITNNKNLAFSRQVIL